jgi:hypothetical protein
MSSDVSRTLVRSLSLDLGRPSPRGLECALSFPRVRDLGTSLGARTVGPPVTTSRVPRFARVLRTSPLTGAPSTHSPQLWGESISDGQLREQMRQCFSASTADD